MTEGARQIARRDHRSPPRGQLSQYNNSKRTANPILSPLKWESLINQYNHNNSSNTGAQMSTFTARPYRIMKGRGCLWLCVICWPLSPHSSAAGQEYDSPLWSRQPWPLTPAQAGLGCRNVLAVGMGRSVLSKSAQRDSMYRAEQDRLRALAGCTASHMEMMPECDAREFLF